MKFQIRDNDSDRLVIMAGSFDFSVSAAVKTVVDQMSDLNGKGCVLDLENLDTIDSAGLGMIILMNDAAVDNDSVLRVRGATGQVRRMLDVSNFGEIVEIE